MYDFCINSKVHKDIIAPKTLDHRFIHEDVGCGLVALSTLGRLYGVELPNINSVIQIFSTIMGIDYYKYGRNLSGLTRKIIRELS
ncbi:MAG: NAD/NADP octopine/nopaline dehydrogenase family protein [Bacteroidales bacterium]|nr:NAD/NADP octopine/nopaline dehydrogenase family protein [Bacteroidales bacterium]